MINKINKLPQSEFVKVFANIFENATWIAEELYKQKPFLDFNELSSKMMNIFEVSSKEKKLKILNDHPDLGSKAKISELNPTGQMAPIETIAATVAFLCSDLAQGINGHDVPIDGGQLAKL